MTRDVSRCDHAGMEMDEVVEIQPPMLLGNPNYFGTLAAVRSLGRAGVKVVTIAPSRVSRAGSSRHVAEHLRCPPVEDTCAWVEWLSQIGRTGPRRVIYATSDAVSFALARYREEIGANFALYQPDLDTIMRIFDKGQLIENARATGIDTPDTWFPKSAEEAAKIAREEGGKFLIKPRSQLAQRTKLKGTIAEAHGSQLSFLFDSYVGDIAFESEFARKNPESLLPLLQRYYPAANNSVYSLSGFREQTTGELIIRGAKKVLQHPPQIGAGLCFEDAPVHPVLADQTARLCKHIGYYGAFELEFIIFDDKAMLIDFNGRFYHQLAFDIARGMDLPVLVYAAALGDQVWVDNLMARSKTEEYERVAGFCDRFRLSTRINMQRMLGRMRGQEAQQWRAWSRGSKGKIIDAVADPDDSMPMFVDIAQQFLDVARHPRAFVRQFGLAQ